MAPHLSLLAPRIPPYFANTDHSSRVLAQLRSKQTGLEKYIFLNGLKERDPTHFYEILLANMLEVVPILYTPTVSASRLMQLITCRSASRRLTDINGSSGRRCLC